MDGLWEISVHLCGARQRWMGNERACRGNIICELHPGLHLHKMKQSLGPSLRNVTAKSITFGNLNLTWVCNSKCPPSVKSKASLVRSLFPPFLHVHRVVSVPKLPLSGSHHGRQQYPGWKNSLGALSRVLGPIWEEKCLVTSLFT